jgi:hypothetical protein
MARKLVSFRPLRLYISFTGPSDKMSDDFEFGSNICMMMSDDLQTVQFVSEISLNDTN